MITLAISLANDPPDLFPEEISEDEREKQIAQGIIANFGLQTRTRESDYHFLGLINSCLLLKLVQSGITESQRLWFLNHPLISAVEYESSGDWENRALFTRDQLLWYQETTEQRRLLVVIESFCGKIKPQEVKPAPLNYRVRAWNNLSQVLLVLQPDHLQLPTVEELHLIQTWSRGSDR